MNAAALKQDSRVHDKVEETQVATAESASIRAQIEDKRWWIMLAIQQAMLAISYLMLAISHVMDKIRGDQDIGQKKHWRITRSGYSVDRWWYRHVPGKEGLIEKWDWMPLSISDLQMLEIAGYAKTTTPIF